MVSAGYQCDQLVAVFSIHTGIIDGFFLEPGDGIIKIQFAFRIDELIELKASIRFQIDLIPECCQNLVFIIPIKITETNGSVGSDMEQGFDDMVDGAKDAIDDMQDAIGEPAEGRSRRSGTGMTGGR